MTIRYMDVPLAPEWKKIADRMMAKMIAEKVIPAHRSPLNGFEWGIFALSDEGRRSKPIGMSIYFQPEERDLVWLDLLYVEGADRGFGIGQQLLRRTFEKAAALGVARLELGVYCHNAPMISLAERCGLGRSAIIFEGETKAVPA
ncbi:MAG: GNAT family N-acetyltransferase [Mesorhizobium sp.]|nr:MAG: GNAT family N-acetyltransferase [Mesorhizobium sp.]